ncbi:MAG: response regulator transcription factor [Clostridia bacterium]|nr:response regulator transcription factor [Clostridia bacterium]
MYKILICDDEKDIVSALKIYLTKEGYQTKEAYNGEEAVEAVKNEDFHLVLMDIMMPVKDGMQAMADIRKLSNVPVILLTAKSEDNDKLTGLDAGADDYITKPFLPAELLARVRSQLRRYTKLGGFSSEKETKYVHGNIVIDTEEKSASVDGERVSLTPTEFEILKLLIQNPGVIFSPKEIYRRIWKDDPYGAEGTVAVHIRHLREKIEIVPAEPRYLKAVWGQGYKIEK